MNICVVRVLGPAMAKLMVPRTLLVLTGSSEIRAVCQAAATIGNTSVTARCGSVLASVQVVDQGNGSIGGTLTTQKESA